MKYGLQLYSVRDAAAENFEETLKQIAEMGYDMVESAGFFNHTAEDVKAMLNHYGLSLCSAHTNCSLLFNDFENILDFHKKVGCKNIVLPGVLFTTKEELDYSIACINRYQPIIESEGMKLHCHNHSKEFWKNKDGLIAEDELARRTDIMFELDTFWIFNAGLDPLVVMEQYKDRLAFIHLKDGIPADPNVQGSKAQGKSIGSGKAPIVAVRKKAMDMGLNIIIESEGLNPTGLEEAKRCIDHLRVLDSMD